MLEPTSWPGWIQATGLFIAFAVAVVLGVHAYNAHVHESGQLISRRKWMYWLYSVVFLVIGIADFAQLCISTSFGGYTKASFYLGYFTLLLAVPYVAFTVSICRRS